MLRGTNPLLEAREVSFEYETGRALDRVSFFVDKGERIAILGHNGSGKSTLARIIGGLVEPKSGACLFNGTELREIEFRELRSKIGLVFQDPENQIVASIVEDDVAFAPENQGLPSEEIQLRVDMALAATDLLKKKDSPVYALSGGEKQRVAIAGILSANVECIILDEPTAMLDPESRLNVEKILRLLHGEGMTIVQITHQIETESFSDIQRVIVLSKGRIKWEGSTAEFWDEAENLGFELPDSLRLERYCQSKKIDLASISPAPFPLSQAKSQPSTKFSIEGLSFRHERESYALRDVDAKIYSGQWLSIIGRTGSGKSTLVQHLNALYKVQEGKIIFDGQPLPQKGKELQTLRRRVGLVFQNPEAQLFSSTVRDELAFAPGNAGFKGQELDDAVLFGLECVGLSQDFLTRNPIALSGGERRLVAIASVLSARPEVVVLDEPLAGLDASYQRKILAMLDGLKQKGHTIITITHDLDMALTFSDRLLILRASQAVKEGSPHEVINEIMSAISPEAWPEVLKVSSEIRKVNKNFPLFWNYEEMIQCISQA